MLKLPRIVAIIFIIIITVILPPKAAAVENPALTSTSVSATVLGEPDTPTLISPANNSTIGTIAPTFIFNPSLGSTYVTHYQLWLDGNLNTNNIGNSTNTITANALTALTEGQHTWMIKALGEYGTSRNSATWIFTIDATAPLILINQVAEHETSLSSLDLTTIPPGLTFATNQRQPRFAGQSEANAQITLILTSQLTSYTLTAAALTDNTFSFQPSSDLNPETYSVTVISTDPAGNTTTLPEFNLTINSIPTITLLNLPSPLPAITIPRPQLPFGLMPSISKTLTAFPIFTACGFPWWFWLIILILLFIIFNQRRKIKALEKQSP